jgi:uncharacterized protein DUF4386
VQARVASVQTYARIAGLLFLISFVAGGFGEDYVPSRLMMSGDASATAQNFKAFDSLFRMGFAGYLVEAVCDDADPLCLAEASPQGYRASRRVLRARGHRRVCRRRALLSCAVVHPRRRWLFRGYLIFRSGYLPKFLGVLMTLGGLISVDQLGVTETCGDAHS